MSSRTRAERKEASRKAREALNPPAPEPEDLTSLSAQEIEERVRTLSVVLGQTAGKDPPAYNAAATESCRLGDELKRRERSQQELAKPKTKPTPPPEQAPKPLPPRPPSKPRLEIPAREEGDDAWCWLIDLTRQHGIHPRLASVSPDLLRDGGVDPKELSEDLLWEASWDAWDFFLRDQEGSPSLDEWMEYGVSLPVPDPHGMAGRNLKEPSRTHIDWDPVPHREHDERGTQELHVWTSKCSRYRVVRVTRKYPDQKDEGPKDRLQVHFQADYAPPSNGRWWSVAEDKSAGARPIYYKSLREALEAVERFHLTREGVYPETNVEEVVSRAAAKGLSERPGVGVPAKSPQPTPRATPASANGATSPRSPKSSTPKVAPTHTAKGVKASSGSLAEDKLFLYRLWKSREGKLGPTEAFNYLEGRVKMTTVKWCLYFWRRGQSIPVESK